MNQLLKDWKAIQKAHAALFARNEEPDEQYWKDREILKLKIGNFIQDEQFGDLPKNDILQLCGFAYKYQPMALHRFLTKCQSQFELLTT